MMKLNPWAKVMALQAIMARLTTYLAEKILTSLHEEETSACAGEVIVGGASLQIV